MLKRPWEKEFVEAHPASNLADKAYAKRRGFNYMFTREDGLLVYRRNLIWRLLRAFDLR